MVKSKVYLLFLLNKRQRIKISTYKLKGLSIHQESK